MLSKCSHDFHYCIHRVFIMNILIIYDCPFFRPNWCILFVFHNNCSILPRNHTGQKNKSNRSQSKEAKKPRSRKDKSQKGHAFLTSFLPASFLPAFLAAFLPSCFFHTFFLIRNIFSWSGICFWSRIIVFWPLSSCWRPFDSNIAPFSKQNNMSIEQL